LLTFSSESFNFVSPIQTYKNLNIQILSSMDVKLGLSHLGTQTEGVREEGAAENNW